MIKRILPIILYLCLISGVTAMAANSTDGTNADMPAVTEEMPTQDGGNRQGGGPDGMGGQHPGGENAQGGKAPAMPDGEMPIGEATPPEENGQQEQPSNSENTVDTTTDTTDERSNRMQSGGMNGGMDGMNGGMREDTQNTENGETASQDGILDLIKIYSTPITAVILLALAFVFVLFYKRKTY